MGLLGLFGFCFGYPLSRGGRTRYNPRMAEDRGRTLPLSLPRRWIGDMLHFADRVPVVAGERIIRVRSLVDARRALPRPPAWNALVIKGLGLVSARIPAMRQAYLPYPWPKLYEAPYSVASVVFERDFAGESATFMAPLVQPETRTLAVIQAKVKAWKDDPIEAHGVLRRIVRNAKPPRPIRRMIWAMGLYGSGFLRARNFGTFAVNSIAGIRSKMLMFKTPITSVWYYGVVTKGEMVIQLAFDHRVFDGATAGRASAELEAVFNNELLDEVRNLPHTESHAPRLLDMD
jgi:hypothetical protein